jgi:hypothetical protein
MADDIEFLRVKSLSKATTEARSTDVVLWNCAAHNLRELYPRSRDKESGPIDLSRRDLNVILSGCDKADDVVRTALGLVCDGGWEPDYRRLNAAVGGEAVFSLPAGTKHDDAVAFFKKCIEWGAEYFDAPVLSAVVHLDQSNPHCHVIFLPVRGGQWRGGYFFGKPHDIDAMHAAFHIAVGRPHGLRRQQDRPSIDVRRAAAEIEFDALMARPELLNGPAMRQAMVALMTANPDKVRAAREQAEPAKSLIEHLQAGNADAAGTNPGAEKGKLYALLELPPSDAAIHANDDDQGADINLGDGADPVAALPSDPAPQPIMPGPVRIDVSVVDVGHDADADEPLERLVRVRDIDLPADRWDGDQGEHIALPPPRPSMRSQVLFGVHAALGARQHRHDTRTRQMPALLDPARPRAGRGAGQHEDARNAEHGISVAQLASCQAHSDAPAPAGHADGQPIQLRDSSMSPARITLAVARAGRAGEADLRRMLRELGIAGRLQCGEDAIRPGT